MSKERFRIGEVAREAGVNIQTLRYYERRGLLKKPDRRPSGYREYSPDTVQLIRFIKRAQELGFMLTEIQELLWLRDDHDASCADVRARANAKIADIDHKIDSLCAVRHALQVLVKTCVHNGSTRECPILESLDNSKQKKGVKL
ncbi:MAG: MerR family transcriptional regulator [candidate division Zixibacteria bacterium]|nr:MerR family transcriptional regulator [candidate division Zixibacteria bacterium]